VHWEHSDKAHLGFALGHQSGLAYQSTISKIETMNDNVPAARLRDVTERTVVGGIFADPANAEAAINDLKAAGFRPEDVGVAMRGRTAQGELVEEQDTETAEGAGIGALSGAFGGGLLGGVVGFLIGIGALAIPGIGPAVAGGALAAAFGVAGGTAIAGAGIGAAAGGLVGALMGMGFPEEEARYFESGFRAGGVLITVSANRRAAEVVHILERNGGDTGPGVAQPETETPEEAVIPVHPSDDDAGVVEAASGTVAGAAAGAIAGSVIAGPAGTIIGGAIGAIGGGAAGKTIHQARDPDHDDKATEGTAGGAAVGGVAGAALGSAVAGPPGTVAGGAIGGATGAAAGAAVGAEIDEEAEAAPAVRESEPEDGEQRRQQQG
jgi:hypothetical protein